jgi:hypothetical protein
LSRLSGLKCFGRNNAVGSDVLITLAAAKSAAVLAIEFAGVLLPV